MTELSSEARRAFLVELKARHAAFVKARLTGDEARAILRANVARGIDAFLASRVEDVMNVDALVKALDVAFGSPAFENGLRPLVKTLAMFEIVRLREDATPLGDYVPDKARADIRELLEKTGGIAPKLVKQIAEHEASEAVMREVLDHVIKEFQEKVNPFTSEWGLPSLLRRMGPLGFGLAKGLDTMQGEFEKHVEPELKRFLHGAAKRALKLGAGFVVERTDQPSFVALRRELFAWFLEQPTNEVLLLDEDRVKLGESATFEIARHIARLDATKRRRRATLEMIYGAHRKQTVREALSTYGIEVHPDVDAITGALYEPIVAWVKSSAADAFFAELIGGFYDREIATIPAG